MIDKIFKLLFGMIIIVMLASCGTKETTTPEVTSPSTSPSTFNTEPEKKEPVDLYVYSIGGAYEDEFERDYNIFFKDKLDHIRVHLLTPRNNDAAKLANLILTGQQVDILYGSIGGFFGEFANQKLSVDHTEWFKKQQVKLNRFEDSLIESLKTNGGGEIWGLPQKTDAMGLYYNKEIFDKFGVDYPQDGMTWDEIYELNKQLTRKEGDTQYVGLAVSPSHSMQMNHYSVPFVDPQSGQSTLDNEVWRKILDPLIAPAREDGYRELMVELGNKLPYSGVFSKNQVLAMFGVFGSWLVNNSEIPFVWDMVSYPMFTDLPGTGSQQYPVFWGITKTSQHPDEAMELLKYIVSDEFQMISSKRGYMPVVKDQAIIDAFGSESPNKDKNLKSLFKYDRYAPIDLKHPHQKVVIDAISSRLPDLAMGHIDMNTMLREAKEQADSKLQELMNQ